MAERSRTSAMSSSRIRPAISAPPHLRCCCPPSLVLAEPSAWPTSRARAFPSMTGHVRPGTRPERISWYGHAVRPLLILWDIDNTLIDADGAGRRLYRLVLHEMYGLRLPSPPRSFAGRTDSAIALEVMALAGVPDPAQ